MDMNNEKLSYNVLDVVCRVGKKLKDSKLTRRALQSVQNDTSKISEYLGITEIQAALFSIVFILNYNKGENINLEKLAKYLDLENIDVLKYYKELQALADKSIFGKEKNTQRIILTEEMNVSFFVESAVSDAIIQNFMPELATIKKEKSIFDLMTFVGENFFSRPSDDYIPTDTIIRWFKREENEYISIPEVAKLKELFDVNDRILLYDFCYDKLCCDEDSDLISTLEYLYGRHDLKRRVDEFKNKKHCLQKTGLVELVKTEIMTKPDITVTDKGIETVLGDDAELYIETISEKDLISPSKINAKELFYSDETGNQINILRTSLEKRVFRELQKRLKKEKMSKGICVLFYGYPGTGKTESVYQIAKATKRRIYHVDISQTKSCYFGESEKIIKEVFTKYERFCQKCHDKKENLPILLFNEADAVFSKRKDTSSSNVAQTENAIQNIILEQMENLNGIMIATTNLNDNFDAAFERRFLFKIKFEKPTTEVRAKIWQNKINSLSETDAVALAKTYDFSGGEIDNIVRKSLMKNIISGDKIDLQNIEELCKTEKMNSDEMRTIGFLV